MSNDRNKIYVDPNYMPQVVDKKNLKLIPFTVGLVLLIAYTIFSIVFISANKAYFDAFSNDMNFFRILSWALSGLAGFYIIGCWLISIVNVALFAYCGQSDSNIIYYISRVLLVISVFCFFIPVVALILIV